MSEIDVNIRIASDRVIIENIFGKVAKILWMFGRTKCTWIRDSFDTAINVPFSLINVHVKLHPLRQQDQDYWDLILSKIRTKVARMKKVGKNWMQKFRENQRQMQLTLIANDEEAQMCVQ